MAIKVRKLTDRQYQDLRYALIKGLEEVRTAAYDDGHGNLTIGYGFNLEVENVRNAVLDAVFGGDQDAKDEIKKHLKDLKMTKDQMDAAFETLADEYEKLVSKNRFSNCPSQAICDILRPLQRDNTMIQDTRPLLSHRILHSIHCPER